jgi:hypothetical protein
MLRKVSANGAEGRHDKLNTAADKARTGTGKSDYGPDQAAGQEGSPSGRWRRS